MAILHPLSLAAQYRHSFYNRTVVLRASLDLDEVPLLRGRNISENMLKEQLLFLSIYNACAKALCKAVLGGCIFPV